MILPEIPFSLVTNAEVKTVSFFVSVLQHVGRNIMIKVVAVSLNDIDIGVYVYHQALNIADSQSIKSKKSVKIPSGMRNKMVRKRFDAVAWGLRCDTLSLHALIIL